MDKPLHRALDFWAGIDGSDSKAVGEALSALSLSHLADVPVRMLSTGQRKRAMLARVVAAKAPIWLLDEPANGLDAASLRSEEHTSELQSLMRISYAVFCLKKKKTAQKK